MHVLQCTNGHFFDGDKYSVCPHCGAASAGGDSKKKERSDSFFHRNKPKTVSHSQSQSNMGDDVTVVLPQSDHRLRQVLCLHLQLRLLRLSKMPCRSAWFLRQLQFPRHRQTAEKPWDFSAAISASQKNRL